MRSATEIGLIVAIAGLASYGTWMINGRPSGTVEGALAETPLREGEIRLEDALKEGAEGTVWIDSRREDEWRTDGLEGSIHLTTLSDVDLQEQIENHAAQLFEASRVIVYCSDVNCGLSHELAERLRGYPDVIACPVLVLHGGMAALRAGGLVTSSSRGSGSK